MPLVPWLPPAVAPKPALTPPTDAPKPALTPFDPPIEAPRPAETECDPALEGAPAANVVVLIKATQTSV